MMSDHLTHFKDIETQQRQSQVTNEKILSDNVKTKNKFIELTNDLNAMRIEMEGKINKFVESNIDINVEIKGMFGNLSNELFRIGVTVENQHTRFEEGMRKLDEQVIFGEDIKEKFQEMEKALEGKVDMRQLEKHLIEAQSHFQTSNRRLEERLLCDIKGMIEESETIRGAASALGVLKEEMRVQEEDVDRMEKNLVGRFVDFENKLLNFSEQAERNASREIEQIQRVFESKVDLIKAETAITKRELMGNFK